MNRRKFIRHSSLSLLSLSAYQLGYSAITSNRKNFKRNIVGAHVWVYAASQPGYDVSPVLSQIFSDLAYAGFDGVETMEHPLRSAAHTEQIMELSEKYKVKLIGCSYSGQMWDASKHIQIYEDIDLVFSNLSKAGGKTFGVSVGTPRGRVKTEEELDAQASLLGKIITLGKTRGIVLNLHNHTYEVENKMFDLRGTLKRIPDINLGPDLNWLLRAGVDPIGFLSEFRKNIVFLHLRDQLNNGKWPESLGEGNVDFEKIADMLNEISFKDEVIIELAHEQNYKLTRPLRESLKISRDYMRKNMGI